MHRGAVAAYDAGKAAADATASAARHGVRSAHGAATGPHFSAVGKADVYLGSQPVAVPMPQITPEVYAANSLWRAGSRTFFNDPRAARIGDILTVRIDIADSAEVRNTSRRTRSGSTEVGITGLFGKQESLGRILPPGGNFDPENLVGAEGNSTARGDGSINREERVELTVAAVVNDILPNGNLVIAGRQEVRINAELRELTIAGIIRPEDISADNTIRHTQIAEARISYGGRGQITSVQRPRLGQRIVDAVSPF